MNKSTVNNVVRRAWLRTAILAVCVFVALTIAFTLLTVAYAQIPSEAVRPNMEKSLEVLDAEGNYSTFGKVIGHEGFLGFAGSGNQIDNYTNMWMIQAVDAEYYWDDAEFSGGMPYNPANRLPIEGDNVAQTFKGGLGEGNYWSGYRLFFKPLLTFFDVWCLRLLQIALIAVSAVWAFARVKRDIGLAEAVLMTVSLLAVNPLNVLFNFDQGPDVCQAFFSCVTVLWMLRRGCGWKWFVAYFMALGMIEIFINCLIMPLLTLVMPLMTYVLYNLKQKTGTKRQVIDIVKLSFAWGLGYVGTFMTSWLISATMTQGSRLAAVMKGLDAFLNRSVGVGAEVGTLKSILLSVQSNINSNIPFLWLLLLMLLLALAYCSSIQGSKSLLVNLSPVLLISALPFLWIVVLHSHSRVHGWMVHDIFAATIWGVLCCLMYLAFEIGDLRRRGGSAA